MKVLGRDRAIKFDTVTFGGLGVSMAFLGKGDRQKTIGWIGKAIGFGVLALPLLAYGRSSMQRPPRMNLDRPLFEGISYQRTIRENPYPIVIHTVAVDLGAPGLEVLVTPGNPTPDNLNINSEINTEINARTTTEFLREFDLQLAVNASFFYPFSEDTPWEYYPHSGDRTNAVGLAISDGQTYSEVKEDWPALCFGGDRTVQIQIDGACPEGTSHAVAGNQTLVEDGQVVPMEEKNQNWYGRTAVGIDPSGQKLWIVAVDGKQPEYSEGITLTELAQIFLQLGANSALNLDGGGSTTLAVEGSDGKAELLNAPVQTKLPMRERPIANHIGFYAQPLSTPPVQENPSP